MFIRDGLAYLTVRCLNYEEMESFPKVLLTPSQKCKPLYLDNDGQWEDSDNKVIISSNVSDTSFTQSNDFLESIM